MAWLHQGAPAHLRTTLLAELRFHTDGPLYCREFTLWHNLNHKTLLPGSHSLLSFLGERSHRLEITRARWAAFLRRTLCCRGPAVQPL